MSSRYPSQRDSFRSRAAEAAGPPHAPADEVEGCPPHYWLIQDRTMTCRKCGAQRQVGRDGRVELPAVPVEPEPVAGAEPAAVAPAPVESASAAVAMPTSAPVVPGGDPEPGPSAVDAMSVVAAEATGGRETACEP